MPQQTLEQLKSINPELLTEVVRRDQSSPAFEIIHWDVEPLGHVVMNPMTGGLYRFSGLDHDIQGERIWFVAFANEPK